jgi:uncharacterized membrane protein
MCSEVDASEDMKTSWLVAGVLAIAYAVFAYYVSVVTDLGAWFGFIQSVGVNTALAFVFGRTLTGGRQPLVTKVAAMVHEEMSPEMIRYTRQVTTAWTLFFIACALVSTGLFFFAPIEAWSVFANILSLPLIGLMFLVENEVRKRTLPKRDQVGLLGTVRALRAKFKR